MATPWGWQRRDVFLLTKALAVLAGERSPGDAQLGLGVEFTPQRVPETAPGEQLRVGFQKKGAFGGVVFEQLHSKPADPSVLEQVEKLGSRLGHGIKEGVAATGVRPQRMRRAHPVSEVDAV